MRNNWYLLESKVWLLLVASFIVISSFMALISWVNARHLSILTSGGTKDNETSDYLGKYFLYNVNVLTNHGIVCSLRPVAIF